MAIGKFSRNGCDDGMSCALGVVDIERASVSGYKAIGEREATESYLEYQATVFVHL